MDQKTNQISQPVSRRATLNGAKSALVLLVAALFPMASLASGDFSDLRFSSELRKEMNDRWKAQQEKAAKERRDARNGIGYAQEDQLAKAIAKSATPWGVSASSVLSSSPDHPTIEGLAQRNDMLMLGPQELTAARLTSRQQTGTIEASRLETLARRADSRAAQIIGQEFK